MLIHELMALMHIVSLHHVNPVSMSLWTALTNVTLCCEYTHKLLDTEEFHCFHHVVENMLLCAGPEVSMRCCLSRHWMNESTSEFTLTLLAIAGTQDTPQPLEHGIH